MFNFKLHHRVSFKFYFEHNTYKVNESIYKTSLEVWTIANSIFCGFSKNDCF